VKREENKDFYQKRRRKEDFLEEEAEWNAIHNDNIIVFSIYGLNEQLTRKQIYTY
jgi:hypothetical protein